EYPVFLFDDVLSEIDSHRREYLLGSMKDSGRQMIITTCEKDIVGDKVYEVEKGVFI
ncbi:MAG: DNA replication and repair protein RecF, partial [Clostridiales bacterium]|nr:DNA replication and repair protein RecF [Clostridiales bacterium]